MKDNQMKYNSFHNQNSTKALADQNIVSFRLIYSSRLIKGLFTICYIMIIKHGVFPVLRGNDTFNFPEGFTFPHKIFAKAIPCCSPPYHCTNTASACSFTHGMAKGFPAIKHTTIGFPTFSQLSITPIVYLEVPVKINQSPHHLLIFR